MMKAGWTWIANSIALLAGAVAFCFSPSVVSAKSANDQVVEIKCLLSDEQAAAFSARAQLKSNKAMKRVVCFFDTASMSLFKHEPKLILRARYDSTGGRDTTVKIRDSATGDPKAECEFDEVIGKERTMSCSFTDKTQKRSQIKAANAGGSVKKIFSKERERALENVFGDFDWKTLKPYGPVAGIDVWKGIRLQGLPPLTIERWTLPARAGKTARILFEVSTKVPLAKAEDVSKELATVVGVSGGGNGEEAETKTRIVLDHFATAQ
jgi:hypothetical protein